MSSLPITAAQAWHGHQFTYCRGQADSRIKTGEDYPTRNLSALWTMAPDNKPKSAGLAMIPSSYNDYDARSHEAQRANGSFVTLAADIDGGNHSGDTIQTAVEAFTGGAAWLIYSSAHSRPGDTRWRIILPLAEAVPFATWYDAQTALFTYLDAQGIKTDRALSRAGQLVYLPNVPHAHKTGTPLRGEDGEPLYFERRGTMDAPGLDLGAGAIAEGIAALRRQRAADEQERAKLKAEAERRRAARPAGNQGSLIDDFNAANSIADMLALCGYEQCPRHDEDWRSPQQTGETYATRVMGSKWVSLSGSDAASGLGEKCAAGCYGDAFDLFAHYKHGGDRKAALRQLGAERRADNVMYPPQFHAEPPEWMAEAPLPEADDLAAWEPDFEPGEDYLELAGAVPVADCTDTFQLLGLDELENLPPPSWLIDGLITDSGLSILYGDPGSGKSFVTIDMALRIALGMDWHGAQTKRAGVIYIAGEGVRGLGNRVKGWRLKHGLSSVDGAPFVLMPVAAQLLDPVERAKLIRTIDAAKIRMGCDVGLIVIDTVSRSIAGQDENGQETMSAFVKACDDVREHCGGAVLGVHHSGKDKDKGMRGSTVLLGACDATFRVQKADTLVTVKCEKQKDGEEAPPIYLKMERHTWTIAGEDKEQSTLVPIRTQAESVGGGLASLSREQIRDAFAIMTDAWTAGNPLSHRPETRKDGRHAPSILAKRLGGNADTWAEAIAAWLETSAVAFEMYDKRAKRRGLQVLDPVL